MAGWTDYADWTSENTIKLVSGNDLLLSLIHAINERLSVMVQYFPYPPVQEIGEDILLCSLDTIKSSIQTAILLMLPNFLNPERISNRLPQEISFPFDGFAWSHTPVQSHDITYTDILTAINASEKFNYNEKNTPELWYKWIYQQYLILNKLTKVIRTSDEFSFTARSFYRTGHINTGWNNDWTENAESVYSDPLLLIHYAIGWDGPYDDVMRRYVSDINMSVPDIGELLCNIDFYAPVSGSYGVTYYNELNTAAIQLKQFGSFTAKTTGDELYIAGPFGQIDTIPSGNSSKSWSWGIRGATVISLDFAVDGGFEFIAGS